MRSKRNVAVGLLVVAVLAAAGHAQSGIYVEYWNGSDWVHVPGHPDRLKNPPDPGYISGSDIDIVNANNVTYRVFAVSPSSTDIGDISINAPSNTVQPRLLVGRFTFLTEPTAAQRLDAAGCRYLSSISSNLGKVRAQAWVTEDILAGGVDTHEVVRLDVDGDILGPVSHRPVSGTPKLGMLRVVGDIDPSTGGVVAFAGSIGTIQTVSGDLLCGVSAITGDIEKIQVGGTIGTPGDPVAIEALGAIKLIDVPNGDLHAEITATKLERNAGIPHEQCVDVGGNIADTTIILTDSIRDNFIITGGDFTQNSSIHAWAIGDAGVLTITRVSDGMGGYYGGYLKGDITFTGNLSPQSPFTIDESLEGTLSIGNNLWDTVTINGLSSAGEGLVGQIIVNAVNGGGQWLSPVVVGSTTLSPQPYYDDSSADLGGGAVGQVPYYLHYADCTPSASKVNEDPNTGHDGYDPSLCNGFHVDKVLGPGELLQYVTLSHYGPIGLHGPGMPVTIKRRTMLNPCGSWTDVTSSFSFLMHPNGAEREIRLSGPFADGFIYWIQPNNDDESSYLSWAGSTRPWARCHSATTTPTRTSPTATTSWCASDASRTSISTA